MTDLIEKLKQGLFLLLLAAVPAFFFLRGDWVLYALVDQDTVSDGLYSTTMEDMVKSALPMSRQLAQLGLDLRLLGGQREQNGIFISENGLMRNIDQENRMFTRENTAVISEFAQQLADASNYRKNVYLAVIPTSGGVLTQDLPQFAQSQMVDQRRLIEELYNRTSDLVRTVDVFSSLRNRREQYIYYRTENNLTALGGFYTYTALARRLGVADRSVNQFDIEYVDHSYYGDLYQSPAGTVGAWGGATAPYRQVKPDTLSLFTYGRAQREYIVTQTANGEKKTYHTLYPRHLMELGSKMDVYLGGAAAITEIASSAPYRSRLLVFGDKTAMAYLPFLVNHYGEVTLCDLFLMAPEDFAAIRPEEYDNVLFVYGIETFIHTQSPAMAGRIAWEDA